MPVYKVEICGVNTSKLPLLTNDEKEALFKRILEGDKEAREQYIKGNLRLVLSVIQRFASNNAENVDDLFQIGCIGLMKAVDNFDITQGVRFSTYAVPMILPCRGHERSTKMTRKQALSRAIALLSSLPPDEETKAVQEALQELAADLPVTGWDEKTVFDTVEQFFLDHGRYPNAKEFESRGLPSHPTIANRFGMTVVDFLDTFYPQRYDFIHKSIRKYREYPKEHWLEVFKEQMKKHQIRTAAEYNRKRTEGPGWAYIAHLFGVTSWNQLLACANLRIPPKPPANRVQFTVSRRTNCPDIESLKQLQAQLQAHMLTECK